MDSDMRDLPAHHEGALLLEWLSIAMMGGRSSPPIIVGQILMKDRMSALTTSACVVAMP